MPLIVKLHIMTRIAELAIQFNLDLQSDSRLLGDKAESHPERFIETEQLFDRVVENLGPAQTPSSMKTEYFEPVSVGHYPLMQQLSAGTYVGSNREIMAHFRRYRLPEGAGTEREIAIEAAVEDGRPARRLGGLAIYSVNHHATVDNIRTVENFRELLDDVIQNAGLKAD